jgi:UDP-N-acetylglucosamine 2-epimerase
MEIPNPKYNLGVGSANHGRQTGEILIRIEEVMLAEKPDVVIVFGDTNSTLAAALAASKLRIKLAHAEAGLRSYNRVMPEEHNRILTDHCSDLLFCPSSTAVKNLRAEGITAGVHRVGDLMYDALLAFSKVAEGRSTILSDLSLLSRRYLLATVHRPQNVDDPETLGRLLRTFDDLDNKIIFPVHPRTHRVMSDAGLPMPRNCVLTNPVGYLDMLMLERNAAAILTDSGGVQKEAYWFGVPCITLRDETEWVETVQAGWNVLTGSDPQRILSAVRRSAPTSAHRLFYGDGSAAKRIASLL